MFLLIFLSMYLEGGEGVAGPSYVPSPSGTAKLSFLSKHTQVPLPRQVSSASIGLKAARPDMRSLHAQLGSTARFGPLLMLVGRRRHC